MEFTTMVLDTELEAKEVKAGFGRGPSAEKSADRIARMIQYWADPDNQRLIPIGKLLAVLYAGKALAQWMLEGMEIPLPSVKIAGVSLPLREGFVLSLRTVADWGCPACHSAHGSGVAPSKDVSFKGLVANKFFYNPATQSILSVSTTCQTTYLADLGITPDRFRTFGKSDAKFAAAPVPAAAPAAKVKGK